MRQRLSVAVFVGLALTASAPAALAQGAQIAALVNDQAVSEFDVQQRMQLHKLSGKAGSRKDALDELVEERLKLSEARKLKVSIGDTEVDAAFGNMAKGMKLTPEQLTMALSQRGISAQHFKARIKAEYAWRKVLQQKLRGKLNLREPDILAAAGKMDAKTGETTEYAIHQVIFVTPKDSGEGYAAQRRREAEALRGRFSNCEQDLQRLKGVKDVVVRDLGRKRASELPKDTQEILESTAVGRLAKPNVTATGVELIAVCGKRQVVDDKAVGVREKREEIMNKELEAQAKKLIADLRQSAVIEYR